MQRQKAAKICGISQKISPKISKNFQKFVNFAKILQKIIFIYSVMTTKYSIST